MSGVNPPTGFSDEDVNQFVNMAQTMASKSVLTHICDILAEAPDRGYAAADRLIERVEKAKPNNFSGYTHIDITGMDIKLHISLTICPNDYKAEIEVPPDDAFIKDLYGQYNFIKQLAVAYWQQFQRENTDLFDRIKQARPDVDFTELKISSPDATTLYFDKECSRRIGLLPYYVDKHGKPLRKGKK